MTATDPPIVRCPVCNSYGAMIHHDIRASLLYSCKNCMHEWQIDPAEAEADPTVAELVGIPSARSEPPRTL